MGDELSKNPYPQDHPYHDPWNEGKFAATRSFAQLILDGKIQTPKPTGGMISSDGSANSSLFDAMETWFNSFKLDYSDKYRQEKKDMAAGNLLIEIRQFLKDKGAR